MIRKSVDIRTGLRIVDAMNGYIVTLRTPKKRSGYYVRRGIILADNMEEGLKLAKEQTGREMPGDSWVIDLLEPKKLFQV